MSACRSRLSLHSPAATPTMTVNFATGSEMPPKMTMPPIRRSRNQPPWMTVQSPPAPMGSANLDEGSADHRRLLTVALSLIFASAISLPLLWFGPFIFYVAIIGLAAWNLPFTLPTILVIKLAFYAVLVFAHIESNATIINLFSLIVADFYCLSVAKIFMSNGIGNSIRHLTFACGAIIAMGFLVGVTVGPELSIADPLETLATRQRMLILASPLDGHSVLIETSSIILAASLAGFIDRKYLLITVPVGSLGLIAANNATSIGILGIVWVIAMLERLRFYRIATVVHIICIGLGLYILLDPELLYDALYFLRFEVLGQDISMYRGDYTSGRAQLTGLLVDLANEQPIFGVGHEHRVLEYGVRTITGAAVGATSESPVRLAAKYGWPMFGFMMLLASMPLLVGLTQKASPLRTFFISIGYSIILASSTNSGFSTGQSTTYLLYGPIVWLAILWYSSPRKAPAENLLPYRRSNLTWG